MAKVETAFSPTGLKIKDLIAGIVGRELSHDLGGIIRSWGDTMTEPEIFVLLKEIDLSDSPIFHDEKN